MITQLSNLEAWLDFLAMLENDEPNIGTVKQLQSRLLAFGQCNGLHPRICTQRIVDLACRISEREHAYEQVPSTV